MFTTRAETLAGVTFVALAPDHPALTAARMSPALAARVASFQQQCASLGEEARSQTPLGALSAASSAWLRRPRLVALTCEYAAPPPHAGLDVGWRATNPLTGTTVPVWLAPYVLADVGTGAIMGVPAHDARDAKFAVAHGLPSRQVLDDDESTVLNSGATWDGMRADEARRAMVTHLGSAARPSATVRVSRAHRNAPVQSQHGPGPTGPRAHALSGLRGVREAAAHDSTACATG